MPKLPRINAAKAESILLKEGFILLRSKGSHRIDMKENKRIVIPFHGKKNLHPKIIRQVFSVIENFNRK